MAEPTVKIIIIAQGGRETKAEVDRVIEAMKSLGLNTEGVRQQLEQCAEQGLDLRTALEGLGATAGQTTDILRELGVETGRTAAAGQRLREALGLSRGSLFNFISMVGLGSSSLIVMHKAIEGVVNLISQRLLGALREAQERQREYNEILREASPIVQEYVQALAEQRERQRELGVVSQAAGIAQQQAAEAVRQAADATAYQTYWIQRLREEYGKLLAQQATEEFDAERQVLLEAASSAEDYADRLLALLMIQGKIPLTIDETTRALITQGAMLEYAARQAEKLKAAWEALKAAWEALMGAGQAISGMMSELAQKTFQLGQSQARVGHQMTQAWENYTFRAQQAVESYTFNVEMELEAHQMRVWAAQERFNAQMQAAAARHGAAMAAMAARHALQIEGINQDHLDRLADMEWDYERNKLRMLQQAPWWLQREIQKYQRDKARLEEAGDEEGLAELRDRLRDRLAAIDPIYAQQLDLLEEEFEHERDVEDREWRQRLSRTERMYRIQRDLAAQNFAISQAAARANFAVQMAMLEFQNRQRLERLEFQEQQRQESLRQSYEQQVEDLAFGLGQQRETFVRWSKTEMIPEAQQQWKNIAKAGLKAFKREIYEGGDFLVRIKMTPLPRGTVPPGP